jgi:hypothetical protein
MTDKPFDLNLHTARLLMREPFFAALSRRIDKIRTDSVPTAPALASIWSRSSVGRDLWRKT